MIKLKLNRPLAIFDIEATGLNVRTDRIIELCIVKLMPDGLREVHTFRINPEMRISPESTRIHGISDADVAGCPTFDQVASRVFEILRDCDLGGYNAVNFDIPLLVEEFMRAKMEFSLDGRRVVDAQRIFHKKEPRDLAAALVFFCNETIEGAHGAEADTLATVKVLSAQLEKYPDLPRDIDKLDAFCNPRDPDWADRTGRLSWAGEELTINFGKRKGVSLKSLVRDDPGFLRWILKSDFPRDTQEIVRKALDGEFPTPPSASKG